MPFFRKWFSFGKKRRIIPTSAASSPKIPAPPLPITNLGKVFKELDCPVCFNTCKAPIVSCVNGHIICNSCRTNVTQCPSCREGFSGTRNFFAENFLTNCSQTCRFSSEGCDYLRLKGDNMKPHEQQCMFRPIACIIQGCCKEVPYQKLMSHLTTHHKILGTEKLPACITFHAEEPLINNRKWLPYYIKAYDNVFFVMMEVVRPHFWIWIWMQTISVEDSFESMYTSEITITNEEKKLKLTWEGPVQSIRTSEKIIMKDGFCFIAHEVFLQHFISNGRFTFAVDINKVSRRNVSELQRSSASYISQPAEFSTLSLGEARPPRIMYDSEDENMNLSTQDVGVTSYRSYLQTK